MKIIKQIGNILSWMVALVILAFAGALVLSRFNTPLGIRVFTVMSGSMEPAIQTGALAFTRATNDYQVGDVITVRSETSIKNTVTHRINAIETDEDNGKKQYRLKGDANEEPDKELVGESRVIGEVIGHAPYLGRVVAFSQSEMGFVVLIIIPGTLLAYGEIMTIKHEVMRLLKKKEQSKEETVSAVE